MSKADFIPFNRRYPECPQWELEIGAEGLLRSIPEDAQLLDAEGLLRYIPEDAGLFGTGDKPLSKYPPLLIHRVLKENYDLGLPCFEKNQPIGRVHCITLPSGAKVAIQVDFAYGVSFFKIPSEADCKKNEFNKFKNDLLKEIKRIKGSVFSKKNSIENTDNNFYSVFNVYLMNYTKAEFMMGLIEKIESPIHEKLKTFKSGSFAIDSKEFKEYNKLFAITGALPISSIMYYFMALEGFVNLLYFGMMKEKIGTEIVDIEREINIELKLLLMPDLLIGFDRKLYKFNEHQVDFRDLRAFRNIIMHSKINDSTKAFVVVEDGTSWFVESDYFNNSKEQDFPDSPFYVKPEHVVRSRKIVKDIFDMVMYAIQPRYKNQIHDFVTKCSIVPFHRAKNRAIRFGTSSELT
ncbi:MAG: hypothetical protein P9X24_15815 [Candidatus Hatepunaea meridiana]|nr:hypothetical protein [Candidatus Hatepunaea meridiana]